MTAPPDTTPKDHRRKAASLLPIELIVDVEASALQNGYPIEIAVADVANACVHAWLIRPDRSWYWDAWDSTAEKIHGLSRQAVDRGDDALTVAQELARVVGDRQLWSDNVEYDSFWMRKLLEAAREDEDSPIRFSTEFLNTSVSALAQRNGWSVADVEAVNRARISAADHSAAGDAASWAAAINLLATPNEFTPELIDSVFGMWRIRARVASPWRVGR